MHNSWNKANSLRLHRISPSPITDHKSSRYLNISNDSNNNNNALGQIGKLSRISRRNTSDNDLIGKCDQLVT